MDIGFEAAEVHVDKGQPVFVTRCVRKCLRSSVAANRRKTLLHPVTVTIPYGSVTAIMGNSGSGSSTLLKLIAQQIKPSAGDMQVYNHAHNGNTISFVDNSQQGLSPSLTVRETLEFASSLSNSPVYGAGVDIETPILQFLFLQNCANDRIANISLGEYLRVKLAVALCAHPRILLIDAKVLDRSAFERREFLSGLRSLAERGMTILVVVDRQDERFFETFDNLILLADGRVLYAGAAPKAIDYFSDATGYDIKDLNVLMSLVSYVQHSAPIPPADAPKPLETKKKGTHAYVAVGTVEMETLPTDGAASLYDDEDETEDVEKLTRDISTEELKERFSVGGGGGGGQAAPQSPPATQQAVPLVKARHKTVEKKKGLVAPSQGMEFGFSPMRLHDHWNAFGTKPLMTQHPSTKALSRPISQERRHGFLQQVTLLTTRFGKTSWREQVAHCSDLGMTLALLVLCAVMTFWMWHPTSLGEYALVDQQARFLFVMLFVTAIVSHANIGYWVQTTDMFVKEQQSGLYTVAAYVCAQSVWSTVQVAIVTLLFALPTTLSIFYHWTPEETAFACSVVVLHACTHSALVEAIAVIWRRDLRTHITAMSLAYLSFWLAGYLVPYVDMSPMTRNFAGTLSYTENALRALTHLAIPQSRVVAEVLGMAPARSEMLTILLGCGFFLAARIVFAVHVLGVALQHQVRERVISF